MLTPHICEYFYPDPSIKFPAHSQPIWIPMEHREVSPPAQNPVPDTQSKDQSVDKANFEIYLVDCSTQIDEK
jgi:hypothetical protein